MSDNAQVRLARFGDQEKIVAGTRRHENALVFTTSIGTPLDGPNVTQRLQRLLSAAGPPKMRFHDLRDACASLLFFKGVDPRLVMETLGHWQISLTMNTYSHVIPAVQREVAARPEFANHQLCEFVRERLSG